MIAPDTLAFRTLIDVARQRPGFNEQRCRAVSDLMVTAMQIQAELDWELAEAHLTELKLGILIVLYAQAPSPSTPSDLATHARVTRAAVTDALSQLEGRALIRRQRDTHDRRVRYIRLTPAGHLAAEAGLVRYLAALCRVTRASFRGRPPAGSSSARSSPKATNRPADDLVVDVSTV